MTALQKWLFGYYIEQYPDFGYAPYFGFIRYVPEAVLDAVDSLCGAKWEVAND